MKSSKQIVKPLLPHFFVLRHSLSPCDSTSNLLEHIRVDSRQMGVYDLGFARDGRRGFGGMSYLSSAQIAFIVSSCPKPLGTTSEGVLAQYQLSFPTGLANVLLPGIWR